MQRTGSAEGSGTQRIKTIRGGSPTKAAKGGIMHESKEELLQELQRQVLQNKRALEELQVLTNKLETVNRKLEESETAKSEFISTMRNEMNNPLTSIMGLARRLADEKALDPGQKSRFASLIYAEAFDFDLQLRNIFAAAEIEAGDVEIDMSRVHVQSLMEGVLVLFQHKMDEKGLRVMIDRGASGGDRMDEHFRTDSGKLQLVLTNLISNAIKFSHREGRLELSMSVETECLRFSARDYGIGITEAHRDEIFDRFKQLDSGPRKHFRGQGLGLCVTKALMEILQGKLFLSSRKDRGSIFTVEIPESAPFPRNQSLAEHGNTFIFSDETSNEERM
jgi:signal transduction histidine kinase